MRRFDDPLCVWQQEVVHAMVDEPKGCGTSQIVGIEPVLESLNPSRRLTSLINTVHSEFGFIVLRTTCGIMLAGEQPHPPLLAYRWRGVSHDAKLQAMP